MIDPAELTVVIPTRDRWHILGRTLAALDAQTVRGFDVVVVVDGTDQRIPTLPGARAVVVDHGGPGAARNAGVRATDRRLVLLLGDDMIPEPGLVAAHLHRHTDEPADEVAVLGRVDWHRDVARNPIVRWLDRSNSQFDFPSIVGDEAGWGRFYSCNVSLKRCFFLTVGGFDVTFRFDYEDLDLGYRLQQAGLQLRFEPTARVRHLHSYDWDRLTARYRSRGEAEWMFAGKHEWFVPFFGGRIRAAAAQPPPSPLWPRLARWLPEPLIRGRLRARTDLWFHQQLAPYYLDGWDGARDLDDLRSYLGADFEVDRLYRHRQAVDAEERAAPDNLSFYRTSQAYLYDLTAFAMMGIKTPYRVALSRCVNAGSRLLDYGCGIGSDGLRFIDAGYRVDFADFDNPSTRYLRWRLQRRGVTGNVYDVEQDVPGGYDCAYAFDVIEHVPDPLAFLAELESRARLVAVNLLEPATDETHLHKPLPIPSLVQRARRRGLVHYRRYHGRSHLLIYHGDRSA